MNPEPNTAQRLSLTDFSDFKPAPGLIEGKNAMVYWKDGKGVTLARSGEGTGKEISQTTGEMLLSQGWVLIVIGEGGIWKG